MRTFRIPLFALAIIAFPCLLPACSDGAEPASSAGGGGSGGATTGGGGGGATTGGGGGGSGGSDVTCNGVAVDLSNDPLNCGACGRDCLGAACAAGLCQPTEVAKLESIADGNQLAIDGTGVYWTESSNIKWIPAGSDTPELFVQGPPNRYYTSLALDQGNVYLCLDVPGALDADQRLIMRIPKGNGAITVLAWHDAKNGPDPNGGFIPGTHSKLAVDANSIYWLGYNVGYLYKAPLGGDGETIVAVTSSNYNDGDPGQGPILANGIAYWVDFLGKVRSVPTSGGALKMLGQGPNEVIAVASDGKRLFWTAYDYDIDATVDDIVLHGIPLGGGAIDELDQGFGSAIETDGSSLYGVRDQTITRISVDGGERVTLAAATGDIRGMALDATSVYWIEVDANGSGALMKVAK
jgi:hypothetical protein